jgi:hypothetical protein
MQKTITLLVVIAAFVLGLFIVDPHIDFRIKLRHILVQPIRRGKVLLLITDTILQVVDYTKMQLLAEHAQTCSLIFSSRQKVMLK